MSTAPPCSGDPPRITPARSSDHPDQAHRERDRPRTGCEEDVAARVVRPHQEQCAALLHAEQMDVGLDEAEQTIRVALDEELDVMPAGGVVLNVRDIVARSRWIAVP